MVINVSVQYNGGFLPDILLVILCDYIVKPFEYLEEYLSLQPMLPCSPTSIETAHISKIYSDI